MIKVSEIKKDLFNEPFLEYLPVNCEFCGSPNQVMETFSFLECSNPYCKSRIGYRLYSLLKDLGFCQFNLMNCMDIAEYQDMKSPYDIFTYSPSDSELFEGFGLKNSFDFVNELEEHKTMTLWEFVKIGHFKGLTGSIEKILLEYSDLNDFYMDLSKGSISFIQNLLLRDTEYMNDASKLCVTAVQVYDAFISMKLELEEGIKNVKIINPEIKMGILFACNVSGYKSNHAFIHEINQKLKNQIYLYPVSYLSGDVSFVYWEENGLNLKNMYMCEIETKYPQISVVNSENIIDVLLEVLL